MLLENPQKLKEEIEETLLELNKFVGTEEFRKLVTDLRSSPKNLRHEFVKNTVINPTELTKRKIFVPKDMVIQRSAFRDNRPTLFCVTKYLSDRIRKVTITYDDTQN